MTDLGMTECVIGLPTCAGLTLVTLALARRLVRRAWPGNCCVLCAPAFVWEKPGNKPLEVPGQYLVGPRIVCRPLHPTGSSPGPRPPKLNSPHSAAP
jgi:hypothetical protein